MTTFDECKTHQDELWGLLTSKWFSFVNGVGLARDDSGWLYKVNLSRRSWRRLPVVHRGIRIKYEVVGAIRAL